MQVLFYNYYIVKKQGDKKAMNLKELRESKGITQGTAAESLGVKQSTVCLWERGARGCSVDVLIKLASVYGVTIQAIISAYSKTPKKEYKKV